MRRFPNCMVIAMLVVMAGCSSTPPAKEAVTIGTRLSPNDYENLIVENSRSDQAYNGFYNAFELTATYLNSKVQSAVLQRRAETLLWDQFDAQKEREKMLQENSNQTQFFLSFFVPSEKLNDLYKGNSVWKLYLEANGKRYEGKARRRNGALETIQAIYPYHKRWPRAYDVSFNVPLNVVEAYDVEFIITSSQGTARLKFPKVSTTEASPTGEVPKL